MQTQHEQTAEHGIAPCWFRGSWKLAIAATAKPGEFGVVAAKAANSNYNANKGGNSLRSNAANLNKTDRPPSSGGGRN